MATYLSGIQPSGLPHLGNYYGAIQQHIRLQSLGGDHFYFIADFHALTTSREAAELRRNVREIAASYIALGLDVSRATLWRQSDVPEVCEIAWVLACTTGMGLLERAVSYKDKLAKGIKPNVGLFTYPVLMAADILAYNADYVPVGQDQLQHIEMAQDMAGSFNSVYGDTFAIPRPLIGEGQQAKVRGLDGEKMSKTYGNTIWIFESGKRLKDLVGRIVTDSRPPDEPKDPEGMLLFDFLALLLEAEELEHWRERVRRGGPGAPGYGHLKARIVQAIEEGFADARLRREKLLAHPAELDAILESGAGRARSIASATRDRCFRACGLR